MLRNTFLIPTDALPPLLCYEKGSSNYSAVDTEPDELGLIAKLKGRISYQKWCNYIGLIVLDLYIKQGLLVHCKLKSSRPKVWCGWTFAEELLDRFNYYITSDKYKAVTQYVKSLSNVKI